MPSSQQKCGWCPTLVTTVPHEEHQKPYFGAPKASSTSSSTATSSDKKYGWSWSENYVENVLSISKQEEDARATAAAQEEQQDKTNLDDVAAAEKEHEKPKDVENSDWSYDKSYHYSTPSSSSTSRSYTKQVYCDDCWKWWRERNKKWKDTKPEPPQLRFKVYDRCVVDIDDDDNHIGVESSSSTREHIFGSAIPKGEVMYFPDFYDAEMAEEIWDALLTASRGGSSCIDHDGSTKMREDTLMLMKSGDNCVSGDFDVADQGTGNAVEAWSWHHKLKDIGESICGLQIQTLLSDMLRDWESRFDVKVRKHRVNLYTDKDWKPFHQDSHGYHKDDTAGAEGEAARQQQGGYFDDITIAASFGLKSRDLSFRSVHRPDLFHIRVEQCPGDVLIFDKYVNDVWEHAVPELEGTRWWSSQEDDDQHDQAVHKNNVFTRASIIAWCSRWNSSS
ncbi:unnamed protein product [Amoebophrya sp. A25]|nr:unnamed protein product [Amoebophrya sp. A25]|eukprot:GSA25T00021057001.1